MPSKDQESLRNAAGVHLESGRVEEAIAGYEAAIAQDQTDAASWFGLGSAQATAGKYTAASESFEKVTSLHPESAAALFNKGNADRARGQLDLARLAYEGAVKLQRHPGFLNNLGTTLAALGQLPEAIEVLREAVASDPTIESAHINLSQSLLAHGKPQEAIDAAHAGLEEKHSRSAQLLKILGMAWQEKKIPANAISCLEQAAQINPSDTEILKILGPLYTAAGELTKAEGLYRAALRVDDKDPDIYSNFAEVCRKKGAIETALSYQRKALELDPTAAATHSNLLLTMLYSAEATPAEIRAASEAWADQHASAIRQLPPVQPVEKERLRIGYVSGSFHNHPIGILLEPIIESHHRSGFEIYCYAHQEYRDERTARIAEAADAWLDVDEMDDFAFAKKIQQDRIDILVDLCGHTWPNRLLALAYKPAPVQATWIGYASTTGLPAIDYILADPWIIRAEDEAAYVERVERLPNYHACFRPPRDEVHTNSELKSDSPMMYGCFNNFAKITPTVLDLWSEILAEAPETGLFLKTGSLGDEAFQAAVLAEFTKRGIAAERIRLAGHSPRRGVLEAYREVDLCLDPFPFNGAVTSVEAIWMGVPVLHLQGNRFAARAGESYLRGAGLDEFVVSTPEEYRRKAVDLARNPGQLRERREETRQRLMSSPLCDDEQFTRDLEETYRRMWQRCCDEFRQQN